MRLFERIRRRVTASALFTLCGAAVAMASSTSCGEDSNPRPQIQCANPAVDCQSAPQCTAHGCKCNAAGQCEACSASACTVGSTRCQGSEGTQTCTAGPDGCGIWSAVQACAGGKLCNPAKNMCECAGECVPGVMEEEMCPASNVGACKPGTRKRLCSASCSWAQWSKCNGQVGPQDEKCDGLDNNCNGRADNEENLRRACTGAGGSGTQTCGKAPGTTEFTWGTTINGTFTTNACAGGSCTPTTGAETDAMCNNLDDDCDGKIDNIPGGTMPLQRACTLEGACGTGTQTCSGGFWAPCRSAGSQECRFRNQLEVKHPNTGAMKGVCGGTQQRICTDACGWGAFADLREQPTMAAESCNGLDDDCDGTVDEVMLDPMDTATLDSFVYDALENGANDVCEDAVDIGEDPSAKRLTAGLLAHTECDWGACDPEDWYKFSANDDRSLDLTERVVLVLSGPVGLSVVLYKDGADGCGALQELGRAEVTAAGTDAVFEWSEGTGFSDDDDGTYRVRVLSTGDDTAQGCYVLTVHGLN